MNAISDKFNVNLGLSKNILDVTHVVFALIIGFGIAHRLIGAGAGTIFAAMLIGRFVLQYVLQKLNIKFCY